MPSSSSAASSTEHWISTPGAATVAPIRQATALDGASASTGTVVSTSRKPNAAAVAASAASSSGSSSRLVTCAWLDGVRRARSLVIAIVSSAGRSSASTRASFAGVAPAASLITSARGVNGSTSSRAKPVSVSAIVSAATSRSRPCRAMKASSESKSASATPSISTTRPPATTRLGTGSAGASMATRPRDASGAANPSRFTRWASMNRSRPDFTTNFPERAVVSPR